MDRKEFEAKLQKEFPNLYVDMYGNQRETNMAFGIDTGPGWYDMLYNLSAKLERLILLEPEEERANYRAAQVKTKFGSLCFYMSRKTEEMDMEIDKAETDSETMCEQCGQQGKTLGKGWIYTTCEQHVKDEDKHHFEQQEK